MDGVKVYKRQFSKISILNKKELKKLLKFAQCDNWYLEILLSVFW